MRQHPQLCLNHGSGCKKIRVCGVEVTVINQYTASNFCHVRPECLSITATTQEREVREFIFIQQKTSLDVHHFHINWLLTFAENVRQ